MSGTSLDGVDAVLVEFAADGTPRLLGHATSELEPALRAELLALNTSGPDELHRASLAANGLVRTYAQVVQDLLQTTGTSASSIVALGAHGQTVRHRPQAFDGTGYTTHLNNPALLAELTGITVVAEFRTRDVAAGGQGAPLAPGFHQGVFGHPAGTVGVLNLGGISNISLLRTSGDVLGFDCGPANALMDFWCHRHTGQLYDAAGAWAATGQVIQALLAQMLAEPFFAQQPPKSTGRDLFNPEWLEQHLAQWSEAAPQDVQATLLELTAISCINELQRLAPDAVELIVCGGGAYNTQLMQRLQALAPNVPVHSSEARGIAPLQVEAAAFAWLARQCLSNLPGNLPSVTGAKGDRVLGAIYPA